MNNRAPQNEDGNSENMEEWNEDGQSDLLQSRSKMDHESISDESIEEISKNRDMRKSKSSKGQDTQDGGAETRIDVTLDELLSTTKFSIKMLRELW